MHDQQTAAAVAANPQFEWKSDLNIPGVDLDALHRKYSKMAQARDAAIEANPELLKNDEVLKKLQKSRDKVRLGVPAGKDDLDRSDAKHVLDNVAMPKVDNLLICNTCAGLGIRKVKYNWTVLDQNCDDCDGKGLIEKVKTMTPGLSETEQWEERKQKVIDVCVAEGDEEMELQKQIFSDVRIALDGNQEKVSDFFQRTRDYGMSGSDDDSGSAHLKYYNYLHQCFGKEELRKFLPKLARLIKDNDRRLTLLATPLHAKLEGDENVNKGNLYRSEGSNSIFKCADNEYATDPYSGTPVRLVQNVMSKVALKTKEIEEGGDDDLPELA